MINEINLTPEQRTQAGYGTWSHEATRISDGARLYTRVVYRHTTRGEWSAILVFTDGTLEHCRRLPLIRLNSTLWNLTQFGSDIREEKRG